MELVSVNQHEKSAKFDLIKQMEEINGIPITSGLEDWEDRAEHLKPVLMTSSL